MADNEELDEDYSDNLSIDNLKMRMEKLYIITKNKLETNKSLSEHEIEAMIKFVNYYENL